MTATHVPLGSTVCLKAGNSPDLTLIECNRDGTVKLALFDGERDHYMDVAPDAIELSNERAGRFKNEAALLALCRPLRTRLQGGARMP